VKADTSTLAVLASHPVQYYAPLFRELAKKIDLHVYYAHRATPEQQSAAGFEKAFEWDIDLASGYRHSFLKNVSRSPDASHFNSCDTPEIRNLLKKSRPSAVLTLGWYLKSLVQGIASAKFLGIPVLVRGDSQLNTPRPRVRRMTKNLFYPPFLRFFDTALYVGERNRAYFEYYRYPSQRLIFSPHCVDTNRFASAATPDVRQRMRDRYGIKANEHVVLFAGKLIDFKRPLDALHAVAHLRRSGLNASLMIAGSGPLESTLRRLAREEMVPSYFLGFQNQSAMPAAYAASDVLVLPSTGRETWGLVCNEALACGRPIVVSDAVGCAPDLAADMRAGRVFRCGDVEGLAKKLTEVIHLPPRKEAIAEKSSDYSLGRAADSIVLGVKTALAMR
jgi:glycosyltransferase involved in cell wall biosynthesis